MLSASVTKVSKNRQVRRAIRRRARASFGEIANLAASAGATLTQRAIAGEISQPRIKGAATGTAARPVYQTASAANEVMNRLPAIWPAKAGQPGRSRPIDWAAVVQSSRRRRLTYRR